MFGFGTHQNRLCLVCKLSSYAFLMKFLTHVHLTSFCYCFSREIGQRNKNCYMEKLHLYLLHIRVKFKWGSGVCVKMKAYERALCGLRHA